MAVAMMEITPMGLMDISAVMEIENHSQLEPWSKEIFLQELDQPFSHVYAARIPDWDDSSPTGSSERFTPPLFSHRPPMGVVGYICFWIIADEVQILNLTVHKSYRRRGIAGALLLHALKIGCERNARLAVLEVRKSNLAAQLLYRSVGFRSVGERPDYYGIQKEPAVLMELELDAPWKLHWL